MENLNQLFNEAGTLMLTGMVFVFAFLGILVVIITTVLAPLAKKFPDAMPSSRAPIASKKISQAEPGISPGVVAAITTAVVRYRQQHQVKK
jgi:oxaloacetate decarboxylase gamma subunit